MPVVANPQINDLVLEGIMEAGDYNPTPQLLARAQGPWIEQIKNAIWHLEKKPKILQTTSYTVLNQGQSRYAYPSDYSSDLTLNILYGTNQGTAQAGSNNTITLSATDASGPNILGKEILILSGNGQGSLAQIVNYNSGTKVAGMVPNWSVNPGAGSTYMIVDVEYPVETRMISDNDRMTKWTSPMIPQYLYPLGNDQSGYFAFNCPPDITYGARLRYYAHLLKLDTAGTVMSAVYRDWRNIFVEGIRMRKLMEDDDDRGPTSFSLYQKELSNLIRREMYGMDNVQLMDRITDYY